MNLADADARPPASCLDEERLHAELRDRWPAADLHHLRGRAEGGQRLFDETGALLDEIIVDGWRGALIEDIFDGG